jgi:hypothetical protein
MANNKAIVTASMIWLGILIVASQDWGTLVKGNITEKATGKAVTLQPKPGSPTSTSPSPVAGGAAGGAALVIGNAQVTTGIGPSVVSKVGGTINAVANDLVGFGKWVLNGILGVIRR